MTRPPFVARITPPGTSALATLAARGEYAWAIVRKFFHPRTKKAKNQNTPPAAPLPEIPTEGSSWFGQFGDEFRDEVILVVTEGAPIPTVEIHCHGGSEIVRLLLDLLAREGCEIVPAKDFAREVGPTRWRSRLMQRLAHAPTTRCADLLLQQLHGTWETTLRNIIEKNDPVPHLRELAGWIPLGKHLVDPWTVVIAGAPNVGKSSLINALAGYTRAVVSPIPGTTRDVVRASLAIDGWPIDVLDTAGIRASHEPIERAGIDLAHQAIREADLGIWLVDGSETPIWPDDSDRDWLFVVNKTDLSPGWDWESVSNAIHISARASTGLSELGEALVRRIVPTNPPFNTAIPWDAEAAEAISASLHATDAQSAKAILHEALK